MEAKRKSNIGTREAHDDAVVLSYTLTKSTKWVSSNLHNAIIDSLIKGGLFFQSHRIQSTYLIWSLKNLEATSWSARCLQLSEEFDLKK